jgi:hypothetical protein
MARWMVSGGGWFVGQFLIPPGTVLDSTNWVAFGLPLPWLPPIDAMPLDQEAWDISRRYYSGESARWVIPGPGFVPGP